MKKKLLALFLCCALSFGLVTAALITPASADDDFLVYGKDGAVAHTVVLPKNEKAALTAVAASGSGLYQWQIQVGGDVWANIAGATGVELEAGYALVANLLYGGAANLRCRLTVGEDVSYTNTVTVQITDETPVSAPALAPKAPTVISEAEAVGEPTIIPPQSTVEATPAADSAPAAEAALTSDAAPADEAPAEDSINLMSDEIPADEGTNDVAPATYSIIINYVFKDGSQAANPWTATVGAGTSYTVDITSPIVVGYKADQETVHVDVTAISKDETYTVTYSPDLVDFTVKYYQQNVTGAEYTLAETETKKGYTEDLVGADLAKEFPGFYSLIYVTDTKIAADGSTEVEIYYDRYYYLMKLNLDGGYGLEPIYARYGTPITIGEPTKPGYTFAGWNPALPATMPARDITLTAQWELGKAGFNVVFWYEIANDDGYSVAGTFKPANVAPGTTVKSSDYKNQDFTGGDTKHFTYNAAKAETVTVKGDGSTVLNVYYTRNTYTLTFRVWESGFLGFGGSWKTVKTITAKYGADIHDNFPIKDGNDTIWWKVPDGCKSFKPGTQLGSIDTMPGENITFDSAGADSGAVLWYYVETLNGATGDYTHDGKNFKLYKKIDIEQSGWLTYTEEFHNITGFSQWWSDPAFSKMEQGGTTSGVNKNNYLCYTRNSYNLKFYNYNSYVDDKGGNVQYEAPLNGYNFTPAYPSDLEPNAYVFAGWYTTVDCLDGTEVNFDTMTMPASDVILYAKWTTATHTVKTFLTEDVVKNAEPLNTWEKVPHNTTVTAPAEPKNGDYKFDGWFYRTETGEEKAYDFQIPVHRDLDLYAKWSSNVLVQYAIKYAVKNDDGSLTYIAEDTVGSALAGTTKTFDAKTGTQLNEGYQTGYFPETGSHSITFSVEGNNDFTFIYVPKPEVPYTVKYLEKGTGNVLHDEKNVTTYDAVVTETFVAIKGYAPDAYQKRLVLSAEGNEIIFWYTKDDVHAPVQIIHWTQNIAGDNYTEYQSSTNLNGVIGNTYSETPLNLPGFKFNGTKSNSSGELTAAGLVLNLYYDRIEYPYEFRFLEQGTDKVLAEAVTGNARYQKLVTQGAKDIPGYTLVSAENQSINIAIEEGATAVKNVKTFYYTEQTVDIKYVVVGPDGCGTLDNYQEVQLKVMTGTPKGSTPTANPGFKFVGWYSDKDCVMDVAGKIPNAVNPETNKLTPQKRTDGYHYEWTYYAKFEPDVADLTITKQGYQEIDEGQSFIFKVTGGDLPAGGMDVVIQGNGSVTIKGLKIGTYTVTEVTNWSWRYKAESNSQSIGLKPAMSNTVNFTNTRSNGKWLDGNAYSRNEFIPKSAEPAN